jgi:tetratricopeptide (TPR) repeat protein/tRNA A-37 threonylcarbamoyl transferase component Bud32
MPEYPLLDRPRTSDPAATTDEPLAAADRAGGVGIPAGVSNPAARYRLGEEIARGGMGTVYRATDTVLGREVAVKVLQEKYAPDSGTARRFADEARITGQLQHPNIPAVHDLGVLPDGRPFLAMKLIKGDTLDDLLKGRADPAADRGRFVAAFEQVCQAVAYAHAHDVIHRDLKPANVMVGAFGEVQVMDWGLAKVLGARPEERTDPDATTAPTAVVSLRDSDELFTQAGSVLGTPAFMPPEQAAGAVSAIDRRSDVFGLGAVLAVVLTGRPPFVGDTSESTRVKAAQGDVDECFARLGACGADPDLVALCRRCLAPRPEDRPSDAGAVAQAVAALRAAADERARRAELDRVQAAEQGKRRRVLLAAGGALMVALLAGLGVSLWQMRRAMNAEEQAKQNLQAEQVARHDEAKAREQAFAALRSMATEVIARKFGQGKALTDDDRAFLKRVIAQFDAFAAIKGEDADSRALRAEGRFRVATMRYSLGEQREALESFDQALSMYQQLAADFPARSEFRRDLGRCHSNRGLMLRQMGRLPDAERDFDLALTLQKQLVSDSPADLEARRSLAITYLNRANLLFTEGRLDEAERDQQEALGVQKKLAADFPSRPDLREQLASSHSNRAVLLGDRGRNTDAFAEFEQALIIRKQLAAEFPARPELRDQLASTHSNRGRLLFNLNRLKEADQEFEQSVAIYKQLAIDFPARPDFRHNLARSFMGRSALLSNTDRRKDAENDNDQAIRILKQLFADSPAQPEIRQDLATTHNNRGNLLRDSGRLPEAEQEFDQALSIREQLVAELPNQPELRNELAMTGVNLAVLFKRQGNWTAAERRLVEARPHHLAALKANGQHPVYRQNYRNNLGAWIAVRAALLEPDEAVRTADQCRDLGWSAPADAYNAACYLSQCIPIVSQHDKLDAAQRERAVQFYGDAAMTFLRNAVSKGYKDVPHMKKDTDLDPLRQREDFQKLIAELEGK